MAPLDREAESVYRVQVVATEVGEKEKRQMIRGSISRHGREGEVGGKLHWVPLPEYLLVEG